ncbi:hypothetical protein HMPREF9570_00193 [Cutibacterium acnes HL043PA1]|nr:hypothetical protein HMPREF9570_00193 [Cutibacterium acnes HL043PA1]
MEGPGANHDRTCPHRMSSGSTRTSHPMAARDQPRSFRRSRSGSRQGCTVGQGHRDAPGWPRDLGVYGSR